MTQPYPCSCNPNALDENCPRHGRESEHLMECRTCGQLMDMRDLGEVFKHEHQGLSENLPGDLPRGRRISGPES